MRGVGLRASRRQLGTGADRHLDERVDRLRHEVRRVGFGHIRDFERRVGRQAHGDGERAATDLQRPFDRLQIELGLRPRRLRLQHVGDRGQADVVPFVRLVEGSARELERDRISRPLRTSRQIGEGRALDGENGVLDR